MLEGEGSVPSGAGLPGDASASPAVPDSSTGSGGGAGSVASAGGGAAPGPGGGAVGGEGAPAIAAAPALSKFAFAGREWDSQKQAEEAYKASFGRNWQGKLDAAQRDLAQREAEIQALRSALTGGVQGQGTAQGQPAPAGPHSFAEKFVKSGDLEFITGLLQDPDPQVGVQKFTVALMDRIDREVKG